MAKWDVRRLLADCDLRQLAPYVGIRTKRSGSTTFIECLSGMHSESDINHMVCDHNGCYCFTCHASYDGLSEHNDAISTVRQFRRITGGDDSFDAACETIAEFLGNRDRYILSDTNGKRQKVFPLSEEEMETAGFQPTARRTLQNLYQNDEAFVLSVLLNKLEEMTGKLKSVSRAEDAALSDAASERLAEVRKIYGKLSS